MDDFELLQAYAHRQAEGAFATLVGRHLNLVYSAALRQTGGPNAAEDVTQAVFLILARKAGSIRRGGSLAGWLLRTTRFTAANARRREQRRQNVEREAMSQAQSTENEAAWMRLAPLLDEALVRLSAKDRSAVALRFFEQRSFKEIGAAMGLSENSARMRVVRAVERLRTFFVRRGVAVSGVTLTAALSAGAVQGAPAGMAATITLAAAKGAGASGPAAALAQLTLNVLAWSKLKAAAAIGLPLLLVAGTGTYVALWEKDFGPNLVQNGGFEQALQTWGWHVDPKSGAQASITTGNVPGAKGRAARISVARSSLNFYDCIELSQGQIPVRAGHQYAVTFRARSSVAQAFRVKVIGSHEPWPFYGFRAITEVTPQWRKYRLTSHITTTADDGKFMFQCGATEGEIWIDDVKFQDCGQSY